MKKIIRLKILFLYLLSAPIALAADEKTEEFRICLVEKFNYRVRKVVSYIKGTSYFRFHEGYDVGLKIINPESGDFQMEHLVRVEARTISESGLLVAFREADDYAKSFAEQGLCLYKSE